jgi:hypothetical protein
MTAPLVEAGKDRSGPTTLRPPTGDRGGLFFDETLGNLLVWNGTAWVSAASGTGAVAAAVTITHTDGSKTQYAAASTSEADMGAALNTALSAWLANEELSIIAGTYNTGGSATGTGIAMPSGSTLRGPGSAAATIKDNHANCIVFASNCTLMGFTIRGGQLDAMTPTTQKPLTDFGVAATGVVMRDINVEGESDGLFPTGAGSTVKMYDCIFSSYFDSVRITGAGALYDLYNCQSTVTTSPGGGYATTRGFSVGTSGTLRLWNCRSTNSNNSSTRCCAAHVQAGGTLEIQGGYYSSTNTGAATPHDIDSSQGGTVLLNHVSGTGNNNAPVISGNYTSPRLATVYIHATNIATPATSTTYYIGGTASPITTPDGQRDVPCPVTGNIVAAYFVPQCGTGGSTETGTAVLHQNNTTDTTISTGVKLDNTKLAVTGLNIPVAAGDNLCLKFTTPSSWSVAPANMVFKCLLVIAY